MCTPVEDLRSVRQVSVISPLNEYLKVKKIVEGSDGKSPHLVLTDTQLTLRDNAF